ncbi:nucleotidyl transferase AbiEii/AbiGii toxin family protein [Curtobacterium luteum]|uniref:nucleotidyl transferase AbiEii/AbiGii toxin family protein n=1 Tax=Curtobacterium luteum TaxID=33881 RepID=UPI003830D133
MSGDATYVEQLFDRLHDAAEAAIPDSRREVAESTPGLSREMRVIPNYGTSRQRGVGNAVRLEAGVRGGPNPVDRRPIGPMLVDAVAGVTGEEFAPFELDVLHPARTLVEKLFAVTALAARVRKGNGLNGRQARHFYNIHELLGSDTPAVAWIAAGGSVTEIVRDCERITEAHFPTGAAPVTGSLADADVFTDDVLQETLEAAYVQTCDDLCLPSAVIPTWADVRARVASAEALLTVD